MSLDNSEHKKVFARNLRYYMALKGVMRRDVCDTLGFSYTTFREWDMGRVYPKMGSIEKLANYFGCEKVDLIEDHRGKPISEDELPDSKKALIDFAQTVPDDKAEMILRVMQSILAND